MVNVINDFGFGDIGLSKEDFLKKDFVAQLGYEPLRIDILNDIGAVPFEEAWQNRREVNYEGVRINFVGYHELLLLKAAAGIKQDIADIGKLQERNKKNDRSI